MDSLFCPSANLIGFDGPEDANMTKTSGDVILEQD